MGNHHSSDKNKKSSITMESHPPERSRGVVAACGGCGCCCCCCCCVHSIGSLAGGIYASATFPENEAHHDRRLILYFYWGVLTVISLILVFISVTTGDVEVGVIGVLLGLPGLQIAVALLTAILAAIFILPTKGSTSAFRVMWRVSKYTIIGMIVGILGMVAIGGALSVVGGI